MNHFNYGIIIGAIESAPLLGAYFEYSVFGGIDTENDIENMFEFPLANQCCWCYSIVTKSKRAFDSVGPLILRIENNKRFMRIKETKQNA